MDTFNTPGDPRHNEAEADRLLAHALKSTAAPLTLAQFAALLGPVHLGWPQVVDECHPNGKKKTGPKMTQYARFRARLKVPLAKVKRVFHLHYRLPSMGTAARKSGTKAAIAIQARFVGDTLRDKVRAIADRLDCPRRDLARTIADRIANSISVGDNPPKVDTVRKVLRELRVSGWKSPTNK